MVLTGIPPKLNKTTPTENGTDKRFWSPARKQRFMGNGGQEDRAPGHPNVASSNFPQLSVRNFITCTREKSPPLWGRDNEGGKASDWSRIQNPAF